MRFTRGSATLLIAALLPALPAAFTAAQTTAGALRVRVMAANTSSGTRQSYPNPGPGVRIIQALRPDVVLIQEFNVNATRDEPNDEAAVAAWVADVFGTGYHWFREPGDDSIPNGVISRWPIVESGQWNDTSVSNRDFAFVRIDLPGDIDLWAVSLHLLTRNASIRNVEAQALVAAMRDHPVPEDDYLVIGGDFNTRRRDEPALATLRELVDTLGPFPSDGDEPPDGDTNSRRSRPYDWVLADVDLEAAGTPIEIGDFVFPDGLVFDTRVFTTAELTADFPPALRNDSDAPQMQHMAVVRDFLLGVEGGAPGGEVTDLSTTIDLGGFRLEQTGASASITLPSATILEPGGFLVVGRSAGRAEFEAFWGELPPGVVYLNGTELAGDPGYPTINGGEGYRLFDSEGSQVDPEVAFLPVGEQTRGHALERAATDGDEFVSRNDPLRDATPGRYGGSAAGTGRLVITEIVDAPGSGNFVFEFVELFYDAVGE